jgi:hypothetical protein
MAERMLAHFGVDIMHVIEDEPGRLVEVEGLGLKRTAMIAAAWAEHKAIKEVMIFLQAAGVSTSLAVRIYKKYGDLCGFPCCSPAPDRPPGRGAGLSVTTIARLHKC